MALLRKLRMRRAANRLTAETFSIEQIAALAVTPAAGPAEMHTGSGGRDDMTWRTPRLLTTRGPWHSKSNSPAKWHWRLCFELAMASPVAPALHPPRGRPLLAQSGRSAEVV